MAVLGITFFLTVFADLTVAVQFGLLMVLFIKKMSDVHRIEKVLPDIKDPKSKVRAVKDRLMNCPQATILTVEGPLFFGAAQKFEQETLLHVHNARTLILRMGRVPIVDATGEKALRNIWEECQKHQVKALISGLQPQPMEVLESTGLLDLFEKENVFTRTGAAIDVAIARMDLEVCSYCPHFVFRECEEMKYKGVVQLNKQRQGVNS